MQNADLPQHLSCRFKTSASSSKVLFASLLLKAYKSNLFKRSHLQLPGCYYAAKHIDLVVDFASWYVKALLRLTLEDKSDLHITGVVMAQYHRLPENVIYPLSTCCLSLSAVFFVSQFGRFDDNLLEMRWVYN